MAFIRSDELDVSPPRWVVDGMLPEVGAGIFHGPSYAGKSLAADVELALAITNGTPFFHHATTRGPVVLCLGEGLYDAGCRKQARLARQERDDTITVAAIARDHGDEAARAMIAALKPMTDDGLFIITEPFAVPITRGGELTPGARTAIANIRAQCPQPALIILDALADYTGGLSLSNDASANRLMMGLKQLSRELETCVLAVAHNDKSGQSLLGAQRLYNASDFVISVTPDEVSAPGADKTATIACEKAKFGPEFEPIGYRIEPCQWDEAELDDNDEPTGGTVLVKSATIRLLESGTADRKPARTAAPLPVIRDVEQPRKRSGVRRHGMHAVASIGDATARKVMAGGIMSVRCAECGAMAGMGCRPAHGSRAIALSLTLCAHESRVLDACIAGRITEHDLTALVA